MKMETVEKMSALFAVIAFALAAAAAGVLAVSCNRDGYILEEPAGASRPPVIRLDSETGVYNAKAGRETVISPTFENADGADVEWREEGVLLSRERSLRITWDEAGTHYIVITVSNGSGEASEEIRVDVGELLIPYVSLPFAGGGITVRTGTPFAIVPEIANAGVEGFEISWSVNGEVRGRDVTFMFVSETPGDFEIGVETANADGRDSRTFVISVADTLPFELSFPQASYFNTSTDRYTFPGRAVLLTPVMANLAGESFRWSVDGMPDPCTAGSFMFTPEAPGEYVVNLTVDDTATAGVKVVCVDATEDSRFRKARTADSAEACEVFEWVPAPGQFIGETQTGGMTGSETTHELACEWAKRRLAERQYVSLGAFGGYIIVGFDHSVACDGLEYDFAIGGNSFLNSSDGKGGSNEPGIVCVMQDVNGNGLPDDEWYELRGSETGQPSTLSDYAVTYYRPAAPKMAVQWSDNLGNAGTIDYLPAFHRQDYYYPAWIEADSYTLRGTRLEAQTTQDGSNGFWNNWAFGWGYADNMGSDNLTGADSVTGDGQRNGFRISNAMYSDGTPVRLRYIDFIKVHTGVNSKSGWLGEVSTEVFGFEDLNLR